jgi:hypothetical protein
MKLKPAQRALLQRIADEGGKLLATATEHPQGLKVLLGSGLVRYTAHPFILGHRGKRPAVALSITQQGRNVLAETTLRQDRLAFLVAHKHLKEGRTVGGLLRQRLAHKTTE